MTTIRRPLILTTEMNSPPPQQSSGSPRGLGAKDGFILVLFLIIFVSLSPFLSSSFSRHLHSLLKLQSWLEPATSIPSFVPKKAPSLAFPCVVPYRLSLHSVLSQFTYNILVFNHQFSTLYRVSVSGFTSVPYSEFQSVIVTTDRSSLDS